MEMTMRKMMLAAVAVIGLGFAGSAPVSAAQVYGPALSAAAGTLDMTQNVWWRRGYGWGWHRRGWCYYHPRRCW
jgi:hypothetical protein